MFKISVLIGVFMLVLSVSLQGLWIDHTKTISASQLTDIRSASTNLGIDALTYKLWEKYQTTVRMDSTDVRDSERSYSDTFGFQSMALSIFIRSIHDNPDGAVGVDVETAQYVLNYLNTFNWDDFKLAIQGITPITSHPEWEGLNDYTRGRELCYSLMFYALLVDLLYYGSETIVPEQAHMTDILGHLANLQTWAYDTFINHDPTAWQTLGWEDNYNQTQPVGFCIDYGPTEPKMPQIGFAVNRVHLLSFIGYASLLLTDDPDSLEEDEDDLYNEIKKEFSSDYQLPSGSGCYGLNDYLTTATGMYHSGITYQNRVFYLGTLFFDALNRMGLANLYNNTNTWNCDVIPRMVRTTLKRIDPELHHILQEDDWRYDGYGVESSYEVDYDNSKKIERGLINYY